MLKKKERDEMTEHEDRKFRKEKRKNICVAKGKRMKRGTKWRGSEPMKPNLIRNA